MKPIIAVEGFDGSGKGFVTNCILEVLPGAEVISKEEPGVATVLTNIIQRTGIFVNSQHQEKYDVVTRICRDAARLYAADKSSAAAIVFDRFLCSSLGYADVFGVGGLDEVCHALGANVLCTIWCKCDFDIAWQRVQDRAHRGLQKLSRKEQQGAPWVKRVGEASYMAFCRRPYAGLFVEVDTSVSAEQTRASVHKIVMGIG